MDIRKKTILITGAASGIGRALAQELTKYECDLALVDRDQEGLEQTQELLKHSPTKRSLHVLDLADQNKTLALKEEVLRNHQKIDILINNAGVALGGNFQEIAADDFNWLMRINFHAPVELIRSFLPHMLSHNTPCKIINISSLYGIIAPPGQSAYSASKFALRGFSHTLAHELNHTNVSLLVVHPGGVATAIADNAKVPDGTDPARVAKERKLMAKLLKLPPQKAAQVIIKAVQEDKVKVLVGKDAKLCAWIERLFPVNYWKIIAWLIKR